ncbi:hypothetical protein Tco_1132901 [Tanacetum coccineum]|uniref:Uncharacterized protein n=1 Tax=Tanacetum coccineum TaxID=301880 RepID=A0ABQ5JEY0_9ASTR
MAEHEAKRQKMLVEYNHQISFRADQLPITKIIYVVNPNKEGTMKITTGDTPLNLIIHPNFRLKTLGFKSLRTKIPGVINQAKKLELPPPPVLATFGMTAEDKKRKRTEFLKEVFVTENIIVDGMQRNLIPPLGSYSDVMKGLSECKASKRNIRRIRVKDIVKEVERYLRHDSSTGWDIICQAGRGVGDEAYE